MGPRAVHDHTVSAIDAARVSWAAETNHVFGMKRTSVLLTALLLAGCGRREEAPSPSTEAFAQIVRGLIQKQVASRAPEAWSIQDAVSFARRDLSDLAFAALADRLSGEERVTPARARERWEASTRRTWITASYSSGTFVVHAVGPRPPPTPERRPSPEYDGPNPPTRDQWWESADPGTRAEWLFAYFAENTDVFEAGPREHTPCPACQGAGVETVPGPSGEPLRRRCLRCAGLGTEVTATFR